MVLYFYGYEDIAQRKNVLDSGDIEYQNSLKLSKKCINLSDEYFESDIRSIHDFQYLKTKTIHDIEKSVGKLKVENLTIFLHGWGARCELYDRLLEDMAKSGFTVGFDFWGFGENSVLKRKMTMNDYAIQFIRVVNLFEFDKLSVVAHSFGSRVLFHALKIFLHASDYGEYFNFEKSLLEEFRMQFLKIERIVLTGAAGVRPRFDLIKYLRVRRYKSLKKKCKNNNKYIKKLLKYGSNDYKNAKSKYLKDTFVCVVNSHTFDSLSEIDLKIINTFLRLRFLLIFGRKDKDTPVYMARKMRKKLTNSELVILKNSSHFCFLDEFERFSDLMHKFLI